MVDERELLLAMASAASKFLDDARPLFPYPEDLVQYTALLDTVRNYKLWLLHGDEPSGVPSPTKPCEYCTVPIFFAQLPTGSFLPLELDTVDAASVIPSWRYVVDFTAIRHGERPQVTAHTSKASGPVFVNHMETCGGKDGPRHHVASYVRRWQVNVEKAATTADGMKSDLIRLSRRLTEGA